jgi:hypothetical protein
MRRLWWAVYEPGWRTGIPILEKHPTRQHKDFEDQAAAERFRAELQGVYGAKLVSNFEDLLPPRARSTKAMRDRQLLDAGWPRTPRGGPRLKP